jgi:hypothetical protein
MRVRIARDELRRIRELTRTINQLEAEIAGAGRFANDAKLARAAASPRSQPAQARQIATASTAAATARSTPPLHRVRGHPRSLTSEPRNIERTKPRQDPPRSDPLPQQRHLARRIWHSCKRPTRSQELRYSHQFLGHPHLAAPAPAPPRRRYTPSPPTS